MGLCIHFLFQNLIDFGHHIFLNDVAEVFPKVFGKILLKTLSQRCSESFLIYWLTRFERFFGTIALRKVIQIWNCIRDINNFFPVFIYLVKSINFFLSAFKRSSTQWRDTRTNDFRIILSKVFRQLRRIGYLYISLVSLICQHGLFVVWAPRSRFERRIGFWSWWLGLYWWLIFLDLDLTFFSRTLKNMLR